MQIVCNTYARFFTIFFNAYLIIVVTATKADAKNKATIVNFNSSDIVFSHTRRIVCRIVVIVIVEERAFRECQVAELHGKLVIRCILDKGAIVDSSRIRCLAIGFQLHGRGPLIIKFDIDIQVKSRCVTMALDVFIDNITRIGVKFHFSGELDFRASRSRSGSIIGNRRSSEKCDGSKAEQQIRC